MHLGKPAAAEKAAELRKDVSAKGIPSMFIPETGGRYFVADEETTLARAPFIKGLKKVFSQLDK